jgi:hypothetical protein
MLFVKNTRGLKNPLDWTLQAFKSLKLDLQSYSEVKKHAGWLKMNCTVEDEPLVVFTDKNPKEFNLKDYKSLIDLDLKYKDRKIKFLTNNPSLKSTNTVPEARRLLNNGLYYGVYYNSNRQATNTLLEYGSFTEDLDYVHKRPLKNQKEQVMLIEETVREKQAFREVSSEVPMITVMIEVEKKKFKLQTPSLAALVNMKAIAVPVGHARFEFLEGKAIDHPLQPGERLLVKSVLTTKNNELEALLPNHVEKHKKLFTEQFHNVRPGHFMYQGRVYTIDELSTIVANHFGLPPPLISVCPFIVSKTIDATTGEELTTYTRDGSILKQAAFAYLETVEDVPFIKTSQNDRVPLASLTSGSVLAMLNFKKRSEKFPNVNITGDILRSVVLRSKTISKNDLWEAQRTLELITNAMEYFVEEGLVDPKFKWAGRLTDAVENCELPEHYLMCEFYQSIRNMRFKTHKELGDFAISLNEYIIFLESLKLEIRITEERKNALCHFISNLIYRFLHDHMTYNFPELSMHYQNKIKFITKAPSECKGQLNDWTVVVQYKNEKVKSEKGRAEIISLVSAMHGALPLPEPFSPSWEITESSLTLENKAFLEKIANQFGVRELKFVREHGQLQDVIYSDPLHNVDNIRLIPYRPVVDLNSDSEETTQWYDWLKKNEITYHPHIRSTVFNKVKLMLKNETHMNKPHELHVLQQYIAKQLKDAPQGFWDAVEKYETKGQPKLDINNQQVKKMDDVEAKINEFHSIS